MREIATTDAVGQVLCHDLTQIIKDKKKGPAFSKGAYHPGGGHPGAALHGKRPHLCLGKR